MRYLSEVASWELYSKTDQYAKFVRNPSKAEKETGKYFPRLTGYKRQFSQEANVRMEFSVPKLLYLNNLEELEDKDFPKVIEALQDRLKTMGVIVTKSVLENASVSSVHFSKNIVLQDGYTVSHLISEMNKVNLRKSFDFAKTRFINDGQSLYGLPSIGDLQFFELLITVSGVGPKGALGIMSSAKRELIEQAISSQDSLMFTKIGGIGKKTAERIIVELKNKVSSLGATSLDSATGDLMEGLMALGYKQQEIMNVLPKIDSSLSMEAKLKMALKMLSKK
jgi:Holliday junction DNA helicase RuvA